MAKQKRRSHNEGTVYYANYRGRWVAEITTELGKRKRYYCKTEREAIRKKNEALRELEQGTLATGPQRKLGEYLEDWIENVHKDKLRISTYVKYKKLIGYVVAELGDVWLQKLTPEQVRRFTPGWARRKTRVVRVSHRRPFTKYTACCTWRSRMQYAGATFREISVTWWNHRAWSAVSLLH